MRILVVADVHANLAAFEAALADAERKGGFERVWNLGDIVGYGPDPGPCLDLLARYPHAAVAGNHDRAAAGMMSTEEFNPYAAAAVAWTAGRLSGAERDYLSALPDVATEGDFTLVHGSLRDPVWEYLVSAPAAAAQFRLQTTPASLVGHSHLQFVFNERAGEQPEGMPMLDGMTVELGDRRIIANPGGLGQPRDGDPRAAYALLDTARGALTYHRVEYDIARTQAAMAKAGLPRHLIDRLARGR